MKRLLRALFVGAIMFVLVSVVTLAVLWQRGEQPPTVASDLFGPPEPVAITGYDDDAMEPFLSRDGRHLFFNNSNHPRVDTDIHWARRVSDLEFAYLGRLTAVNTPALDGVPTLSAAGDFYCVSTGAYGSQTATIHRGRWASGTVADLALAPGIGRREKPWVDFDVEVSADGTMLLVAEGWFIPIGLPWTSDLRLYRVTPAGIVLASDGERLLAMINSPANEYAAGLSADARELFFTRLGTPLPGRESAIFLATRATALEPFGLPVRLAKLTGFVEAPTLSPDGNLLYFHRRVGDRFRIHLSRRRPSG